MHCAFVPKISLQGSDTFVADTHGPGFVLEQEGGSPLLTLIFKDEKTAKRARKKFQEIIDSSDAILASR